MPAFAGMTMWSCYTLKNLAGELNLRFFKQNVHTRFAGFCIVGARIEVFLFELFGHRAFVLGSGTEGTRFFTRLGQAGR